MSSELAGKVAIVTGAATGIGKAIALAFGTAGARLVVNHLDTPTWRRRSSRRSHATAARRSPSRRTSADARISKRW
jgi:NAD(P)-dependent dehydrogenase (short-subunit alcohol dehydrogenase family)